MKEFRISKRYASALFSAASDLQALEPVTDDVKNLLILLEKSPEFAQLIGDSTISPQFKSEMFQNLFTQKIDSLTLKFLNLLADRQREKVLESILERFMEMAIEQTKQTVAEVTSAVELTESQKGQLTEKLSDYSGKNIILKTEIDPSIKGGFVAKIGDTVFDGSVATQLQRLKDWLGRA